MRPHAFAPPELPPGLEPLAELALDLRWIWSHQADHMWRSIDPDTWEKTRNPWLILQEAPRARLATLATDAAFTGELRRLLESRQRYLATSFDNRPLRQPVAYFSMEYGLGDAIPLYAGGLGVLAGDHLEAASDLGVPMVAVGLLYQEGYFRQRIDANGRQEELYPYNDPTVLPIQPTPSPSGGWLKIPVDLPGRTLWLRVWQAMVGRVTLYLLDANAPVNDAADRSITGKLYGDGVEMRLRQEIALGIGGWRLLDTLGINPGACHLNEGHTAFAVLERARAAMVTHDLSFGAALAATRAGNLFTTHTSVAAGFDTFPPTLMTKYFPEGRGLLAQLGLGFDDLMALGRPPGSEAAEPFRPAYLAVRGSARVNGVSALHAETSRTLFAPLFPRWPIAEVPITHITNGVHVPSWDSSFTDELWTGACGPDRWRRSTEGHEAAIASVDDRTLWTVRGRARRQLVEQVRARLGRQLARRGAGSDAVAEAGRALDADVLTVGLARRFAEYKRPNLLLGDEPRLRRLLTDARRPVQIVVAGKAHPDDIQGKAMVEAWVRFAADPAVRARCVFVEDYDLTLAQELVQGADVWINTPRRPWEACGTSGMKVLVNGGLNLSVLDGWWAEAFTAQVGWAIGGASSNGDAGDADALFRILEGDVMPAFYDRDAEGLPRRWLAHVRASLSQLTPRFSANRMLGEYVARCYGPAEADVASRLTDGAAAARAIHAWTQRLTTNWKALRFGRLETRAVEHRMEIGIEVFFGELSPDEVAVQLYADGITPIPMANAGALPGTAKGFQFRALLPAERPASHYTPRFVPASGLASVPQELALVAWHH